jgi:chromosome segregation ATPase
MNVDDIERLEQEADAELNQQHGEEEESQEATFETAETVEAQEDDSVELQPEAEEVPNQTEVDTVPESRYKDAVKAMNKAQQELAERRKRDAEVDTYIQQLQEQNRQLLEQLQQAEPKDSTPDDSNNNVEDDDLKAASEMFPEVVTPLMKYIEQLKSEIGSLKDGLGSVKSVADDYNKQRQVSAEQQYWSAIKDSHPDVEAIANSPEYADWYSSQPPAIQQAVTSSNPQDVVAGLNLYRAVYPRDKGDSAGRDKPDKLAAAKAAAGPNVKSTSASTTAKKLTLKDIDKMSNEEFMKREAEIDELYTKGELA